MKNVIKLVLLLVFSCFSIVYAETNEITSTASVTDQTVTISGQLSNISASHQVTLLVGSIENIIYIDQKATSDDGVFEFIFNLPDNLASDTYEYKMGSNAESAVHSGTIEYINPIIIEQRKFMEADIDVTISGYKPVISGAVYCAEGKTIELMIRNTTDNTTISDETITSDDGVVNISHTLPSLLSTKEYEVSIVCSENNTELVNLSAVIDSSILLVDISGTATTADNVSINAQLQSVNTGLIDKSTTFTGTKTLSGSIPNLVSNASFNLFAEGYETVTIDTRPQESYSIYTFNGTSNDEILIAVIGNNITSFEGKNYELIYDENKVKLIGLLQTVDVVSNEAGKLVFKMRGTEVSSSKYWSGVMNLFKFEKITEETVTTEIKFREIQ